ncbi:MAG: hypothetical protein LBU80_02365 [Rikenellaceae bacterium]|jgi:hypothetical protein|nr:hypothetical protein [Rikenellaceae bacterium]
MASRRDIKKDIDYLVSEVVSNCYTCLYFHPDKKHEQIIGIIEEAIELRNELFSRIKPAEKNNARLVRKHYAALRIEMLDKVDGLFSQLSAACK